MQQYNNITTNALMDLHLRKLGGWDEVRFQLPESLEDVVYSDFVTENDCITLSALNQHNPIIDNNRDKCWWEYNETNFHPDWFDTDNEIDYLKAAIACAKILIERLEDEFPDKEFMLHITFYETDDNNPDSLVGSSTVRFYQVRDNINLLLGIDENPAEATLEISINP